MSIKSALSVLESGAVDAHEDEKEADDNGHKSEAADLDEYFCQSGCLYLPADPSLNYRGAVWNICGVHSSSHFAIIVLFLS